MFRFMLAVAVVLLCVTVIDAEYHKRTRVNPEAPLWGPAGHYIAAALANRLIGSAAHTQCQNLLPTVDGNIAEIASWADDVRYTKAFHWSAPLHFINTPDWACNYKRDRDCISSEDGVPFFCVDGAIQNYTSQLLPPTTVSTGTTDALMFLVHFIGDIHQPLHVGFAGDYGGNDEKGQFIDEYNVKLHEVWDTSILMKRIDDDFNGDNDTFVDYLYNAVQPGGAYYANVSNWTSSCTDGNPTNACSIEWAEESISLACSNAYVNTDGSHIEDGFDLELDYYTLNMPIVEMQLAKAGVRMAKVLNTLWPSSNNSTKTITIRN